MNKNIASQVEEMALPIVENLGYELVEVDYSKKSEGMVLTVYIHNENGITLEDCEKVSKALDEPLEQLNPTNDVAYTFNVSSLGLDRPIKNLKDINRNIGEKIEIKLYAPMFNKKVFEGILVGGTDKQIVFYETNDNNKKEITLNFSDIAKVSKVIDF